MSREKKASEDRRVIIDMSYPHDASVNAFIFKNTVVGTPRDHALPNVESFVNELKIMGPGSYMSSTDVSRAYKNFRSDPLDWPLLAFQWEGSYYTDVSMPFGSRASSCHMQRVADAIVGMLADRDVIAKMYIDDLIILSPNLQKANRDLNVAQTLLKELGLPEAQDKIQRPATRVTWLGVEIDSVEMTVSMPEGKLTEVRQCVENARSRRSLTKKHLQSLLGKIIHVAKCIRPARLFVARLLEALRGMKGKYIKITKDMGDDLDWFHELAAEWNGIGLIPRCIIGASDGRLAYGGQSTPLHDTVNNISELEATNAVVALQTFISERDRGRHVRVLSDSLSSVQIFSTGKGRNQVMLDCACNIWMLQALFDIQITFKHISGNDNYIADALSRKHLGYPYNATVRKYCTDNCIDLCVPCLDIYNVLNPPIVSRGGVRISPTEGHGTATEGTSSRN